MSLLLQVTAASGGSKAIGFTAAEVDSAFRQIQGSIAFEGMDAVVRTLAIFLCLSVLVSAVHETVNRPGGWDTTEVAKHIFKGVFLIGLIMSLQIIINGVNSMLAEMDSTMYSNASFNNDDVGASLQELNRQNFDAWQSWRVKLTGRDDATDAIQDDSGSNILEDSKRWLTALGDIPSVLSSKLGNMFFNIGESISRGFIWITTIIWENVYLTFLCGRYIWLLLLEIVSPVAVVCILHDATRSYFYTWVKNLFCCHLLLPAYGLTNLFSNELAKLCWQGTQERMAIVMDQGAAGNVPEWTVALNVSANGTFLMIGMVIMMIIIKTRMLSTVTSKISNLF